MCQLLTFKRPMYLELVFFTDISCRKKGTDYPEPPFTFVFPHFLSPQVSSYANWTLDTYTHPSLFAGVRQDPPRKAKIREHSTPPPQKSFGISFKFFFAFQKHCNVSCFFFPSTRWTPFGMTRKPVLVVENCLCPYPFRGPCDVFWDDSKNSRNPEVRTLKKQGTSLSWSTVKGRKCTRSLAI
jgi:hypothetical protein